MRVLWLCNIVLPEFSEEFGFNKNVFGGWLTGMLHQLESRIDIALCFPILNSNRAKNGEFNDHKYYSFQHYQTEYHDSVKQRFKEIILDYHPDIINIWGTEYPHALAMVNAAEELGLIDKTVIDIQGMVSVYAHSYYADIPQEYLTLKCGDYPTIEQGRRDFIERGRFETEAIKKVKHAIGRTDWTEACAKRLNPSLNYYSCNRILRYEFYKHIGAWSYENCRKHSIFFCQAEYPIKGFHFLLRAMPDILAVYPDAHIYIGGRNITLPDENGTIIPYGVYLNKLISCYGLENKVTFLGRLQTDEMVEQYLAANVFVSAATLESYCNTVCEAQLLGCPTVASYVGGVKNLIEQDKDTAYLYPANAEYMLAFYVSRVFGTTNFKKNTARMENIVNKENNGAILYGVYERIQAYGAGQPQIDTRAAGAHEYSGHSL